jgi:hypothetical protein
MMSHLTIAVAERPFEKLFYVMRDSFTFSDSNSANFGPFSAGYSVAFHLEGGTIELRNDNTVSIKELDIKWDSLVGSVGFDIPEICVGGWCIPMPWPIPDICLPKICVFSDNPDVNISLDLSGIITSEISVTARPVVVYRVDPARTSTMSYLVAEDAGIPNKWQIFLDPVTVDIDVFDVADIIGDLLENAVRNAIDSLLPGWLPGWAKDLVFAVLGPIIDLIRFILDIPDDVGEWLSDLLGISLGLFNTIVNFVADFFAARFPIFEFEDPFRIKLVDELSFLPPPPVPLIPFKIPIEDVTVRINTDEMIVEANVGA